MKCLIYKNIYEVNQNKLKMVFGVVFNIIMFLSGIGIICYLDFLKVIARTSSRGG